MALAENERAATAFQTAGRNALRGTKEKVRNVERAEQVKMFLELEKERIAKEDIVRAQAEVRVLARFFDRQMLV